MSKIQVMRLGQLARKLSIKSTEILKYLEEKDVSDISNHPNSKIPDEYVEDLLSHFTPSPVEEMKAIIEPKEVEEIVEEIEVSTSQTEEKEEIVENIISDDDLKELAEIVNKETAEITEVTTELHETKEPEVSKTDNNEVTDESFTVISENDEEHTINVVDGVIKAPKVDLEGPKVVGKIDLPQPKAPEEIEVELDEEGNPIVVEEIKKEVKPRRKPKQHKPKRTKSQKPTETEYEKRQVEINRLKEIEKDKLKKKKEAAKKAYNSKMASQPKVAPKKKVKAKTEAPKKVNKYEQSKPTSAWGKFMKWLNT